MYIYKQDLAQYDMNKMCTLNFQVYPYKWRVYAEYIPSLCKLLAKVFAKYVLQIFAEYIRQSMELEQNVQTDCKQTAKGLYKQFSNPLQNVFCKYDCKYSANNISCKEIANTVQSLCK